ncbi:hypothetical protein MBLNU457_3448t1 [Dothideomycetes sp. NU457]
MNQGAPTRSNLQDPSLYSTFDPVSQGNFPQYQNSLDSNQLISPQHHHHAYNFPSAGSVSNLSDVQSPSSVQPAGHRVSFGSSAHLMSLNAGSVDGSDPTSPGSLTGRGGGGVGDSNTTAASKKDKSGNAQTQDDKNRDGDDKDELMPSWAELKTKAGKERKRLPLACIACRRKKIRCSGEKPACKHCMKSRIPCVYKVTTRKAAPRTDYMAMLDKRLKRMEERVIKIMPKDEQRNVDVIGRAVVKPAIPGLPPKQDNKKRVADEAFGDELNEWSRSKSNPKGSSIAGQNKPADQTKDALLTEGAEHLPTMELQQHLAEVFFDYVYGQSYHLLHKPSYLRKLESGQLPPVLVLAVCAISARFSSHPEIRSEPAFLRGEQWAKPAREIALKRYDTPNITILIAYLILGLHEFGTCQGGRSWMLGGMAQRMAYALQLHKDLDDGGQQKDSAGKNNLSFTDREIRRRTMWACFMMDRFNSSGTERPIFVAEPYIEAQLPIKEHYFQMEITGPTENLAGTQTKSLEPDTGQVTDPKENMGCAAYMVRLVAIWGRLIKFMNLGGREHDEFPLWSADSEFAKLRASIDDFKKTLPSSLHWNHENLQNHASEKIANQFILLHIIQNQIVLFMNRFALPVPGSRPLFGKDLPQDFLGECARAALDAASQISILINEAMDHRVVAPFAGYTAFFSSTVHIHGLSSKNPAIEASSKQYLAWNVKYLSKMKKYWGMFYFVTEHLKDLYRRHADAGLRAHGTSTPVGQKPQEAIFQYGDWFDRYPNGVSGTDYEEALPEAKKEPGSDAVLGQKSDLQSVEEFFSKISPPNRAAVAKKAARKKRTKSTSEAAASKTQNNNQQQAQANPQQELQPPQQQPQHHHSQSQPHIQIPHMDTLMQPPTYNSPMSGTSASTAFPQDISNDMALLQAQQRHTNPGIMSQLDRQMVLSSYAGMDPSATAASTIHHELPFADFDMGNQDPFFNAGNAGDGDTDMGNAWYDQSSAWFMPFNVDPPSGMGDDSGLFGGGYDFGGFGAGMGFPDLGVGGLEDLGQGQAGQQGNQGQGQGNQGE